MLTTTTMQAMRVISRGASTSTLRTTPALLSQPSRLLSPVSLPKPQSLVVESRTSPRRAISVSTSRFASTSSGPMPQASASTTSSVSSSSSSSRPLPHQQSQQQQSHQRGVRKELPRVPNTLPYLAAFIALGLASWGGFTVYATNKEKLSSSIFKSILQQVKHSPQVQALLQTNGALPTLKPETWLAGNAYVRGSVNMMQGRVDLSFKIQPPSTTSSSSSTTSTSPSSKDKVATVYFTSIRAHKSAPFEILRFLVVDNQTGESVSLLDTAGFKSLDAESGDII